MNAISCKISKGAFSGEKVFQITASGVAFKSISHPMHLIAKDFSRRLTEVDAMKDEVIDGYVECRIIHSYHDKKRLLVNLPSGLEGETIEVPTEAVLRGVLISNRRSKIDEKSMGGNERPANQ